MLFQKQFETMSLLRDKIINKILNASAEKKLFILDFIKSKKNGATVADVEDFWAEHYKGRPISTSGKGTNRVIDNTIRNTLVELEKLRLLTREKKGKSFIYFLAEEANGLKENLLESSSITDLLRWAVTFNKYKGLPFITELEDVMGMNLQDALIEQDLIEEDLRPYIDFETSDRIYSGLGLNAYTSDITATVAENLAVFYGVISATNETVEFEYRSFQKDKLEMISHAEPWLLKEHNKRWYLIAFCNGSLRPFSLDRILKLTDGFQSRPYKIPETFDPVKHWKDCIGIYWDEKKGVQEVSFELKNGPKYNNVKYLISLPMHSSQKSIRLDGEWTRFEYKIHIGPEVVRQIRQWGLENLRNIQPEWLDEDVRFG